MLRYLVLIGLIVIATRGPRADDLFFDGNVTIAGNEILTGTVTSTKRNLATVSTDSLIMENPTVTNTTVTAQYSPRLRWTGHAWDTGLTTDTQLDWIGQLIPSAGNPSSSRLSFGSQRAAGGFTERFAVDSAGKVTTGTWQAVPVGLPYGGTNANLTASNGGVVYSNATQMQILAGTATANKPLVSGSSMPPGWAAFTLPATTTINRILYSSANNVVSDLVTTNSGVLVTNGSGVPSLSTDLPTSVTIGGNYLYRVGGTDVPVTDGGTGASTAANARTNLGLVIGSNVQAYDADLADLAGLTATTGDLLYGVGTADWGKLGAGTQGKMLQMGASTPGWSSATWPTAAASGKLVIGNGTNYVESTPSYPNSASPTAGKIIQSDGTNWTASAVTWPTTPGFGDTGKVIRVNSSPNYALSTATFADTFSASNLLYSNGANTVAGLATANNGMLVTSSSGVPSIAGVSAPLVISGSALSVNAASANTASYIVQRDSNGDFTARVVTQVVRHKTHTPASENQPNGNFTLDMINGGFFQLTPVNNSTLTNITLNSATPSGGEEVTIINLSGSSKTITVSNNSNFQVTGASRVLSQYDTLTLKFCSVSGFTKWVETGYANN